MNTKPELKLILCCISMAMVAGCGGGGGGYGGGVASPSTSSNYLSTFLNKPNVTGSATADVRRVQRTMNGFQEVSMSDATTATDSIKITFGSDSNLSNVTFSNSVSFGTFERQGRTGRTIHTAESGANSMTINSVSSYMDYGDWAVRSGDIFTQSYFVSGYETPSSNIPTVGDLYYIGHAQGIASKPSAPSSDNTFVVDSNVQITADMAAKNVGLNFTANSVTNISNPTSVGSVPTAIDDYKITGSGTFAGNAIAGGLILTSSGQRGVFTGKFYGPSAENIGGTFTFSGTDLKYTGSFGAYK